MDLGVQMIKTYLRFYLVSAALALSSLQSCDDAHDQVEGARSEPVMGERGAEVLVYPDRADQHTRYVRFFTSESEVSPAWREFEVYGVRPDELGSLSNLALERRSAASSYQSDHPPALAVDGSEESAWSATVLGAGWLELDLGAEYILSQVRLQVKRDRPGLIEGSLQFASESGAYVTVYHHSGYVEDRDWLSFLTGAQLDRGDRAGDEAGGEDLSEGGGEVGSEVGGAADQPHAGDEQPLGGVEAGETPPLGGAPLEPSGPSVGIWRRHILSFEKSGGAGPSPFTLEMEATFTHESTGESLTLPAYYDGEATWRVAFMPTQLGPWSWLTSSGEPSLDGHTGQVTALESGNPGLLRADPRAPNKWRFQDGPPVIPIGLFVNAMLDDAPEEDFVRLADFMREHHFALLNFRLSEHDLAFASVQELSLDLELWRRLERRVELLTERGLGVDLMLYTDDSGAPSFGPQSEAERLLIRAMVARFASFPSLLFNTGIDLAEYRDQGWVNWYGQQIRSLDPYAHPVSSRYGGGSGNLIMEGQTFNSVGARNSMMSELISAYQRDDQLPALNNDNWSEDLPGNINGHSPADLRRAAWKAFFAGGVGFSVRHNTLYCPRGITECDRYFPAGQAIELLDSEAWLKLPNELIREQLGEAYQTMHPSPSLLDAAGGHYALADDEREQLMFLTLGRGDAWDAGDGAPLGLRLEAVSGAWLGQWFDPRSGAQSDAGRFEGGQRHSVSPPNEQDWVLWLQRSEP